MPKVVAVRLRYVSKDYWFNPAGIAVEEGDHVLVDTVKGREIGICTGTDIEVKDSEISTPLKPVLRVATEKDLQQADAMQAKGEEAMETFRQLVEKHELDMKPVRVEFMFSGDFATFYFAADERIDFRALVKDLAAKYHVRVDMRQIGVRDEARMLGGFGHCGEELCCARLGGEFSPVSIRMAKEQDLPLNPTKISGLCGRLMCCLRYEFEAYKDFKGRAPKKNALIDTPMGLAKVVEFDTPRERIRLRMEDGSSVVVPLGSMDTDGKKPKGDEKLRPCHIGQEAWDKVIEDLHKDTHLAALGDKLFSEDPALADKTSASGVVERTPRRRRKQAPSAKESGLLVSDSSSDRARCEQPRRRKAVTPAPESEGRNPRTRRRSVTVSAAASPNAKQPAKAATSEVEKPQEKKPQPRPKKGMQPSRRRRKAAAAKAAAAAASSANATEQKPKQKPVSQEQPKPRSSRPRPGQKSSTLHGAPQGTQGEKGAPSEKNASKPRRRRRSRGGSNGAAGSQGSSTNQ